MIKRKDFIPPYRKAVLKTYNNDLSKRWVIEYWPWCEVLLKPVRKQHFISSKQYKTAKERREYAAAYISNINEKLRHGYFLPDASKQISLEQAIADYLAYKKPRVKSYKDYKSLFDVMLKQYFAKKKPGITVDKITRSDIYDFLDDLQRQRGWQNITRNLRKAKLHNFFEYLLDREIVHTNPVTRVKTEREKKNIRFYPFMPEELGMVRAYLQAHAPMLKLFTDFVYYCFIRPKEVRFLKLGDIDLVKNRIRVSRKISKNAYTEFVSMPKHFKELLEASGVMRYPKTYYVFGNKDCPGLKAFGSNTITSRMRKVLDKLGFDNNYSLYSFKHTGCCNLYELTKDIKLVSTQCRHHSIEYTDTYLRSMGLFREQVNLDQFI